MISYRLWVRIALFYFVLAALLGVVLRLAPFTDAVPLDHRNLVHSHSHVAMLGWVFNALLLAVVREFLGAEWMCRPRFQWVFWAVQGCVAGMFIAFALQGYGGWSIAFSTLHILLSYVLVAWVVRDVQLLQRGGGMPQKLLLAALAFLLLSSLGPWGLAVISAKGLAGTPLYKAAIYWFLHFTYNGWMTLSLLAIWIKHLGVAEEDSVRMQWGVTLLVAAVPGTFLLSLLEFDLHTGWHLLGGVFGGCQIAGLLAVLGGIRWSGLHSGQSGPHLARTLLLFGFSMLLLKAGLQVASAFPGLNTIAFFNRDALILYLHLVFIGWISVACLAYLVCAGYLSSGSSVRIAMAVFLSGFALQEGFLAMRGLGMVHGPYPQGALLVAALSMFFALLHLLRSASRSGELVR